jgi:hypothetical protein
VSVSNGRNSKTSKVKVGNVLKLEVGFIEDIKSSGEAVVLDLVFFDGLKKALRKVVFKIDQDGFFFVNGEKRGKF